MNLLWYDRLKTQKWRQFQTQLIGCLSGRIVILVNFIWFNCCIKLAAEENKLLSMESNSTVESSSESGVLLIASLLTSLKRVPSFKRILRLFNSTSSSSKCSSRRDVSVKMKSTPVLLCNVLPNGDGTDSYDSNYNENATTNHHVKSVQKNLHKLTDDTSNIESLCKVTDVPSYLQFNPFILTGYRQPCMTSYDCLKSLLYFHNETINIMTHGKLNRNK